MANKKTRALRRAEYLRQREEMDTQAREAMVGQAREAMQTVERPRACSADSSEKQAGVVRSRCEEKHSGTSCGQEKHSGEVCQQIQLIPLASIVTEEYQRVMNMRNVAGIVKHFDPAKLGVLVVSHRKDGTYAVLDGQHRLTALRQLGYTATNCIVLEGMSIREEADYFRRQNENKQSLRIADTFNASVWAEDEESLQIKQLMDRYSFRHGKSGQPMCICAIGALQQIIRQFGVEALDRTLACIAATWPRDTTILRREMLAGLGEFWKRYAPVLTVEQFEARMRLRMPMDLYQEVRRRTQGKSTPVTAFSKSIRFVTCAVLVDAYNKGLRTGSKNRLKLEWDMAED